MYGEGSGHITIYFYLAVIVGIITAIAAIIRFPIKKVKDRRRKKEFIKMQADILSGILPADGEKGRLVICAWCDIVMSEGDMDAQKVSYGICDKCRQEVALVN